LNATGSADLETLDAGLIALGSAVFASGWAGADGITQVAQLAQVAAFLGVGAGVSGEVEVAGRDLGGRAASQILGKGQVLDRGNVLWSGRGGSQEKSKDGEELHA